MENCIFCKIRDKEIPAHFIYEDSEAFAILDVHPHAPGHTIIIPKMHAPTLLDLPDNDIAPVFHAVKKVISILKETLKPDAFTVGINHGRISGQEVDHLHIHLMPRYEGDGGGSIQSVIKNPGEESVESIAKKIKSRYTLNL